MSHNLLIDLDSIICEVELYQERALLTCGDITQEYFGITDAQQREFMHERARIQAEIVLDYIYRIGGAIAEIKSTVLNAQGKR